MEGSDGNHRRRRGCAFGSIGTKERDRILPSICAAAECIFFCRHPGTWTSGNDAGTVRAALDKVDRELPIIQPQTMQQIIGDSLGQQRLTMTLLGSFAVIALLLALVGITARLLTRLNNAQVRSGCAWPSVRRRAMFCD